MPNTMQCKKAFIIFLCGIVIVFCSYQKSENKNEKWTLTAHIERWDTTTDLKYLGVIATLTNNSSDTFTYVVESCFYPFEYTTGPEMFANEVIDCLKNIPERVKIPPHKSIERVIRLRLKKNTDQYHDTSFRIGVYLTTARDLANELRKRKATLALLPSSKYVFKLHDTSYKVSGDYGIIDIFGIFKQMGATPAEPSIWSNKITVR